MVLNDSNSIYGKIITNPSLVIQFPCQFSYLHTYSTYACSIALAYIFSITYFKWLMLHILIVYNSLRFANDAFWVAYVTIQLIHVFVYKAHQYKVFVLFPVYSDMSISHSFVISEYQYSFAFLLASNGRYSQSGLVANSQNNVDCWLSRYATVTYCNVVQLRIEFCGVPSVIWCVECIVCFPVVWSDHGMDPWWCRGGVWWFMGCLWREFRIWCAVIVFFCASIRLVLRFNPGEGSTLSIISSQHRSLRTGFEPRSGTRGEN